jgi:hypothetical protein
MSYPNGITGNLVEHFDVIGVIKGVDFYATMWQWTSWGTVGHVWVSGPIYTKSGATHKSRSDEAPIALKDLSPANARAIYNALIEHWDDEIRDLNARRETWAHYFGTEVEKTMEMKRGQP